MLKSDPATCCDVLAFSGAVVTVNVLLCIKVSQASAKVVVLHTCGHAWEVTRKEDPQGLCSPRRSRCTLLGNLSIEPRLATWAVAVTDLPSSEVEDL